MNEVEGYGKVHPHMLEMTEQDLVAIKLLIDKKDYPTAQRLLNSYLFDYPLDEKALFLYSRIMLSTENYAIAIVMLEWLLERPDGSENVALLVTLMHAYSRMTMYVKAMEAADRILEIDENNVQAIAMNSTCYVQLGDYGRAIELAERVLELSPDSVQAKVNIGFANLHLRNYDEGWKYYDEGMGFLHWRDVRVYDGEPRWDGRMGDDVHVLVYSEQGIGDQIAGIEPLRDLMEKVNVVALDCDPKMRKWFRVNFPGLPVLDSEKNKPIPIPEGTRIDYSTPLFAIHKYLRKSEADYPKQPFLRPDPDLYTGWKAIFNSKANGRPVIGLAWSGGGVMTGKKDRRIQADSFAPLFAKVDAYYVSLEYRDRKDEIEYMREKYGIDIDQYDASQSGCYNDVAAMIAALDCFIAPPTAAVHAAGAMGVPTYCIVHKAPNIHYASFGDSMPYYGSVLLLRRPGKEDKQVIGQAGYRLDS